jgi:carbamoyltransferase
MKILWTKFRCHDSSLCYIDTEEKTIFAMSTERISRIKHDKHPIDTIVNEYPFLKQSELIWHSYQEDDTLDELIDTEYKRLVYKVYTPKYIKDLTKILELLQHSTTEKVKFFFLLLCWYPIKLLRLVSYSCIEFLFKSDKCFNSKDFYTSYSNWLFKKDIARSLDTKPSSVTLFKHHLCHAHWSYCMSPFFWKETGVFVLDGWWDHEYSSLRNFESEKDYKKLWSSRTTEIPNDTLFDIISIWNVYSLFTETIGLHHWSDEWKVEALAAFGEPDTELVSLLHSCFPIDQDTNCWTVNYPLAKKLYSKEFLHEQFLLLWKENFCASVQCRLEETVVAFLSAMQKKHAFKRLIISWGVMANVIANMRIFEADIFEEIYITPCMSDEWSWLWAATLLAVEHNQDISRLHKNQMPYRWNEISEWEIQNELSNTKRQDTITYTHVWKKRPSLAAQSLADGKIVALVQWKMEFWPRALWNRSITANPCLPDIKNKINLQVKKRPEYQPFCPSILEEDREELFQKSYNHKHMSIAFRFKDQFKTVLPWAMHIDWTARPQFVSQSDNPLYFQYLQEVKKLTGYGVIINTSFNMHWRTIVRTAEDAIQDFVDCGIDVLVLWDYIITRK